MITENKTLKSILCVVASFFMLAGLTACGQEKALSMYSVDPESARGTELTPTELEGFKEAVDSYGDVYDMSDTFGYPAAAVSSDDLNIIYLKLESESEARSMVIGDRDSDGIDLDVISSGENYDYYEEVSQSTSEGTDSLYGLYLRVDSTLILVTGSLENRDRIKAEALDFYSCLGYPVP